MKFNFFKRMFGVGIFVIVLSLTISSATAFAADRYWVGGQNDCGPSDANDDDGSWDDIDCWSSTNGGSGGASIPGSSDFVYFNDTTANVSNKNISINQDVTVLGVNISSAYDSSLNMGLGYDFTVGSSHFTQAGGNFNINNSVFTVTGTGEVDVSGSANLSCTSSGSMSLSDALRVDDTALLDCNSVDIDSGLIALDGGEIQVGALTITGTTTVTDGTLDVESGDFGGSFTQSGGTTDLDGGANSFFRAAANITGGSIKLDDTQTWILQSFIVGNSASLTHNSGTIYHDHSGTGTYSFTLPDDTDLYNWIVNLTGSGGTLTVSNDIDVTNKLTLTDGILGGYGTIDITNDFEHGVLFNGGTATVNLIPTVSKTYSFGYNATVGDGHMSRVIFGNSNAGSTGHGSGTLTFDGKMQIDGGTLNVNAGGIGNTIFDGELEINTGTVNGYTSDTSSVTFNSIFDQNGGTFDAKGTDVNHEGTVTINGTVSNEAVYDIGDCDADIDAVFDVSGDYTTVTFPSATAQVADDLEFTSGAAEDFVHNNGTIYMDTSSAADLWADGDELILYNLTVDKTGGYISVDYGSDIRVDEELKLYYGELRGTQAFNARLIANDKLEWLDGFDGTGTGGVLVIQTTTDEIIPACADCFGLEISDANADITVTTGSSNDYDFNYFKMNGGTFTNEVQGANIEIQQRFDFDDGTFSDGSGTLTFAADYVGSPSYDQDGTGLGDPKFEKVEGSISSPNAMYIEAGSFDSGEASLITTSGGVLIDGALTTVDWSDSTTVNINGSLGMDFNDGDLTAKTGGTIYLEDSWDQETDADLVWTNGTLELDGSRYSYLDSGGEATLTNIIVNKSALPYFVSLDQNPLEILGGITIQSGAFKSNFRDLSLGGNWDMQAINGDTNPANGVPDNFDPGTRTVTFTSGDQTISGDTTFYNLTKDQNSTWTFANGSTTTVTGTWVAKGTSTSSRLELRSDSVGDEWYIDPQGTRDIAFLDVQDSHNINATDIDARGTGSIPAASPNNDKWIFDTPPVISSLGPAGLVDGSQTADNTPTLTFDVDDAANEDVNYQIIVDDSSDFSSPLVDYTSDYLTEGSLSFTVGQAAGGGTYTTGNQGQTLADTSYYWEVRSTNETSGQTSVYSVANSGAVAFILNTSPPGVVTQLSPTGDPGLSDSTPLFVWQDVTGEDTYTIDVKLASDLDYSSPVLTMTGIPQDSTSYEATSALSVGQDYEWRIYGVSGAGSDPASATTAAFNIINLIPEFSDYLLIGLMMTAFGFMYVKRRELGIGA